MTATTTKPLDFATLRRALIDGDADVVTGCYTPAVRVLLVLMAVPMPAAIIPVLVLVAVRVLAVRMLMRPVGNGRCLVRSISASASLSRAWLSTLDPDATASVPSSMPTKASAESGVGLFGSPR